MSTPEVFLLSKDLKILNKVVFIFFREEILLIDGNHERLYR